MEDHTAKDATMMPKAGSKWRHYKGSEYIVITIAIHSESKELLVVYKDDKGSVWARPLSMWHDPISPGKIRFILVED